MKILFITDNFPPEVNAPATRTCEHCREWAKRGADITVITCAPNFPQGKVYAGYRNRLYSSETIDNIKVIRVWSYIARNEGFFKRILDYVSFSVTSFIAGLFQTTDVIIATSPQFFSALSGQALSFVKRRPWIMEVRDLWPESIKTVGAMNSGVVMKLFEWMEMRCYRSAMHIIVVTVSFKKRLAARGIDESKITVVQNGANNGFYRPAPKDANLLKQLGLEGKTVVGYIGTLGMAHNLNFILNSVSKVNDGSIHFLFIGEGAEKNSLTEKKERDGLTNVTILPPVPKEAVRRYLSILDISLINLRKSELFKSVIPSKIFENAAMQIPLIIGVDGEAREIVEKYEAGIFFEPENEQDFLEKLSLLATEKIFYEKCRNGCKYLAAFYDRTRLASMMLDKINELISRP
jgi:glycosyltransferase involved in cell wall biosynthesis